MDTIHEAREIAEQLQTAGSSGEDKAARRAPYDLVGIRWVDGVLYYDAKFQETTMGYTQFSELVASELKPKPLVESMKATPPMVTGRQSTSLEPTIRVKWLPASFEIDDINPEKALRLLENRGMKQQLSGYPQPEHLLCWLPGREWDTVVVDEETYYLYH